MKYLRAVTNWGHVAGRAVGFGFISCTVGAVTPGNKVSRWCMREWCRRTCAGVGITHELVQAERLDAVPQCVYVANHQSLLDILVLGAVLDRDYRWLAKSSVFKVPFLGWHLSLSGHIPVYRGAGRSNVHLRGRIAEVLEEGASLLFFPEGTRSPDGELKAFKSGAFIHAVQQGIPVQPLVVRGTGELLGKGAGDLSEDTRACSVTALGPFFAQDGGSDRARARELRDRVRAAMLEELGRAAAGDVGGKAREAA